MKIKMIQSAAPVYFNSERQSAGLPVLAGAVPPGPDAIPGIDFIAPLICNPVNTLKDLVLTAHGMIGAGIDLSKSAKFDWRSKLALEPVQQQGKCGGCWAFAVAGCLADRAAIADRKKKSPLLSVLELLSCVQAVQPACQTAGSPQDGFEYAQKHGLSVETKCSTFNFKTMATPPCTDLKKGNCEDKTRYYASSIASTLNSIEAIKQEIVAHGPVASVYRVYRDFVVGSDPRRGKTAFEETDGVYVHVDFHKSPYAPKNATDKTIKSLGDLIGYHAVVIVGWDVADVSNVPGQTKAVSLPYWIVRNSWGDKWGDKGYFKCAMSSSIVNQSVGIDLSVNVALKGSEPSRYGGVFFAMASNTHGATLLRTTTKSSSTAILLSTLLLLLLLLLLLPGLLMLTCRREAPVLRSLRSSQ